MIVMVVIVIVMKCCNLASLKVDKVGLAMLCKLAVIEVKRFTSKVKWRYLGHELVICSQEADKVPITLNQRISTKR